MANKKTLKMDFTVKERQENGRKGAAVTNLKIAEAKSMREMFNILLDRKPDKHELKLLQAQYPGLNVDEITYRGLVGLAMLGKACGAEEFVRADVAAATFIRDTMGEKPKNETNLTGSIESIKKVLVEFVDDTRTSSSKDT